MLLKLGINPDQGVPHIATAMGSLPGFKGKGDGRIEDAELANSLLKIPFYQVTKGLQEKARSLFGVYVPWWPKNIETKGELTPALAEIRENTYGKDNYTKLNKLYQTIIGTNAHELSIRLVTGIHGKENDIDGAIEGRNARCSEFAYLFYSLALASGLDAYPVEVFADMGIKMHAAVVARIDDKVWYIDPGAEYPISDFSPWIVHRIGDASLLLGIYVYNLVFDGVIGRDDAPRILSEMVSLSPGSPLLLFGLARAEYNAGQLDPAWKSLCRAFSIWPTIPGGCELRGDILKSLGKETPPPCQAIDACSKK